MFIYIDFVAQDIELGPQFHYYLLIEIPSIYFTL